MKDDLGILEIKVKIEFFMEISLRAYQTISEIADKEDLSLSSYLERRIRIMMKEFDKKGKKKSK